MCSPSYSCSSDGSLIARRGGALIRDPLTAPKKRRRSPPIRGRELRQKLDKLQGQTGSVSWTGFQSVVERQSRGRHLPAAALLLRAGMRPEWPAGRIAARNCDGRSSPWGGAAIKLSLRAPGAYRNVSGPKVRPVGALSWVPPPVIKVCGVRLPLLVI